MITTSLQYHIVRYVFAHHALQTAHLGSDAIARIVEVTYPSAVNCERVAAWIRMQKAAIQLISQRSKDPELPGVSKSRRTTWCCQRSAARLQGTIRLNALVENLEEALNLEWLGESLSIFMSHAMYTKTVRYSCCPNMIRCRWGSALHSNFRRTPCTRPSQSLAFQAILRCGIYFGYRCGKSQSEREWAGSAEENLFLRCENDFIGLTLQMFVRYSRFFHLFLLLWVIS